jgi:hypothetical protein
MYSIKIPIYTYTCMQANLHVKTRGPRPKVQIVIYTVAVRSTVLHHVYKYGTCSLINLTTGFAKIFNR